MAKSRARFLSELLGTTGLVKKSKSALAGADEVIDLSALPSIPNSKLTNSSITINSSATSLGGSVTLTTANVAENTNLYYTNARADARIAAASTSDLSEGTNLYYTDARADARVALIVDSAPGTLNTLNELAAALGDDASFSTTVTNSIAAKLPLAGGTLTGNLNLGDNVKAQFGASNDLQIYHDGSRSYISDQGTGGLRLLTNEFSVKSPDESENLFFSIQDGSTYLYENGDIKLTTTSTGIDVTGSVVADGTASSSAPKYTFSGDTNTGLGYVGTDSVGLIAGGSRKFYVNDTTAYFQNLSGGVNVSGSVTSTGLTVHSSTAPKITISNGGGTSPNPELEFFRQSGVTARITYEVANKDLVITNDFANGTTQFKHGSSEQMRLSSGNVNIPNGSLMVGSTTAPTARLHLKSASRGSFALRVTDSDTTNDILRSGSQADGDGFLQLRTVAGAGNVLFDASGVSYVNGGNFGIGESIPTEKLHIGGNIKMQSTTAIVTYQNAVNTWNLGLDAADASFKFKDGTDERLRIDSSGNLIVSGTAAGQATSVALHNGGYVHAVSSHQMAGIFDRRDSDGDIVIFRKDGSGTAVGSISTLSGRMAIGTGNTGLFFDSIRQVVSGHTMTGNTYSTTIDLGRSIIPFQNLHLSSTAYAPLVVANDIKATGSGGISFQTDEGTKRLEISDAGNVNIYNGSLMVGATTTPAYPLEVAATTSTSIAYQRTGVSAKKWGFHTDNDNTYWQNITDNVLALTIKNNGNVGIGTTSPDYKLDVEGSGNGLIVARVKNVTGGTTARADMLVESDTADIRMIATSSQYTGVAGWADTGIINTSSGTSGGMLFNVQGNYPYRFMQNATTERMRIHTDGNVGIGTTAPSQKLHVVGKAYATQGFTTDGLAKSYTWRAIDNSSTSGVRYVKICRITAYQSARVSIELNGRSTSYGDGAFPAHGRLVGQLNNDDNYDFTYYNYFTGSSEVVTEIGQVDIDTTSTDIYVKISSFAEIAAVGVISDGDIYPTTGNTGSSQGVASAPTGYTAITSQKIIMENTSGNVGIGTTSVGTKLNIRSDASDDGILLEKSDGTDIARLFHDGTSTNARLDMFSGGSATVQIKASGDTHFSGGNVGIGETSPDYKLHIKGSGSAAQVQIESTSNANGQLIFRNTSAPGSGVIGGFHVGLLGDSSGDALLYHHNAKNIQFWTSATEHMRLDSNGHLRFMTKGAGTQNNASINNHTNNYVYFMGGTSGAMYQADNTGAARIRVNTSSIAIETAGAPRINIAADGETTLSGYTKVSSGLFESRSASGGGQIGLGDWSNTNPIGISEGLWNTVGSDSDFVTVYARQHFNVRGYSGGTTHWLSLNATNMTLQQNQKLQVGSLKLINAGIYTENHVGVYAGGVTVNAATSATGWLMSAGTGRLSWNPSGVNITGVLNAPTIDHGETNIGAPDTANHVTGTRQTYYDSSATAWYARGIEGNTLWDNVDHDWKLYRQAALRLHWNESAGTFSVNHGTPIVRLADTSSSGAMEMKVDGIAAYVTNKSTNGGLYLQTNNPRDQYVHINGTAFYSESFVLNNGTQYDFDIDVGSEGGSGNSFFVIAGYNHYFNTTYGAHKIAFMSARTTSINTMINVGDQSSTGGGAWQFTKPSAGVLRVRKTAGTYVGGGHGFITVIFKAL
jgi:hypothetical protein